MSKGQLVNDGIEEIQWVAALKPNTIGVSDYRDDLREYLEIAVLTVTLRGSSEKAEAKHAGRIKELVHRAVPYPVLLLLQSEQGLTLSIAYKRWAQNEAGKVVLDGDVVSAFLPDDVPSADVLSAFTQALSLTGQPQATLFSLYQGWIDAVQSLLAARLTGIFKTANSPGQAAARRQALHECERLEIEIARLRTAAEKVRQMARRVELNLALKRVQARLITARQQL